MICIRLTIFYQSFFCFFPKQVKITPKTTGPGLIPEARRETLSERPPKLSSDNRHWINTRSKTGKLSTFCQILSPRVARTKVYSDYLLLSIVTTESGVRLTCPGWHLKPISDYLSTSLHFQNVAYLVKNQYKPNNFIQRRARSLTYDSL